MSTRGSELEAVGVQWYVGLAAGHPKLSFTPDIASHPLALRQGLRLPQLSVLLDAVAVLLIAGMVALLTPLVLG